MTTDYSNEPAWWILTFADIVLHFHLKQEAAQHVEPLRGRLTV